MVKFMWNGVKEGKKLARCWYSDGELRSFPKGTITLYAKDHAGFGAEARSVLTVENDSDIQTDYFEKDRIRVVPSHPLYEQVYAAMMVAKARHAGP